VWPRWAGDPGRGRRVAAAANDAARERRPARVLVPSNIVAEARQIAPPTAA